MTHASLFSGIGGSEVAATMLGWDNLFHCEINEFGRKVLDYWFPKSKSYEDITKKDFSEWRDKVDVLTGGFPCQPFSYAGKRRGADDDRYLWPFMFKTIDQIRPTWVVAENVAGITTMVEQGEVSEMGGQASMFEEVDGLHRYRLAETFTLQRICDDLEGHGYSVQPVLIPACAVGAPHRRDRVFIVARRVTADTDSMGRREGRCKESQRQNDRHDAQVFDIAEGQGSSGTTADTSQSRVEGLRRERQDAVHRPRNAADTDGERLEERRKGGRSQNRAETGAGMDYRIERPCDNETVADAESAKGDGNKPEQREIRQPQQEEFKRGGGEDGGYITVGTRWRGFPSVSPVHRGDDGIPFNVDGLSIPFGRWRNESLKAYGNAIVPQVMYEIFRAIELTENQSL